MTAVTRVDTGPEKCAAFLLSQCNAEKPPHGARPGNAVVEISVDQAREIAGYLSAQPQEVGALREQILNLQADNAGLVQDIAALHSRQGDRDAERYTQNQLRMLIDDVWQAATDSQEVPSIGWADELIAKWRGNYAAIAAQGKEGT